MKMNTYKASRVKLGIALTFCVTALMGCHWDMWDQPRYEPLEAGEFFGEGESSSRMPVAGTVPYQSAKLDTHYWKGVNAEGEFIDALPKEIPLDRKLLYRGMERYAIFCTPCHGYSGEGNGMITNRGFPAPPSYHIDRLREAELGYLFDVQTNGFGRMYSYATRIPVEDRWAIAAYLRTLQLSQAATMETLPREKFNAIKTEALKAAETGEHGTEDGSEH